MKIALIGYGNMGRLIGQLAVDSGHSIAVTVHESHSGLPAEQLAETLRTADVAIDFTAAEAVRRNVEACMLAEIPVVVGTTGWDNERSEIERIVSEAGGTLVFGANFSIGVNLFYKIAKFSASLLSKFPEYEVFIEEQHHSQKKDSPSGTALKLKEVVSKELFPSDTDENIQIAATRAGNIPGTHRIGFDGPADQILLEHSARNREGFARGAMLAAEWIRGKKGFFEFTDVMEGLLHDEE